MTSDSHTIDYETLAQKAMRGLVRSVLEQTAEDGLPGDHHFYISFDTCADGVSLSPRLKEKYPAEMTIVLQHRFWDLKITPERFEVKLTFDGIPERLVIPFESIKVFFDPSVRYGLQFEDASSSTPSAGAPADIQRPAFGSVEPITNGIDASALGGSQNEKSNVQPLIDPDDTASTTAGASAANAEPPEGADEERTVLDKEDVAHATEGAKILRLDAFRKKEN